MKFKIPKTDKLLNDKNVLYVVFVLAILNLLGYLVVQNTEAVAFFLIVGFLTTYFSKNMIVVLIVSMVATSLFTATKTSYRSVKEGMSTSQKQETKDSIKSNMEQKKQDIKEKNQSAQSAQSAQANQTSEPDNTSNEEEVEELTVVSKGKNYIDLPSTLSEAYNNLQKTVGEGGVKELTTQTESLLNQQKQLMDNITTMQPFLETAQSFMDKLDLSSLDGIGDLLSNFGKK